MATRSTIALEFADGTVQQIYCHWDGYLEHNGKLLQEYYSDPFHLRELIDMGAISSLCASSDETKQGAYHYWRGEELVISKFKDFEDYKENCNGEEYDYILRQVEGKPVWFVRYYTTDGVWVNMDTVMNQQEETA